MKVGVLREISQLLIKHAQALTRNDVRLHVVDAYLQVLEPRSVQPLNAFWSEVITIRDKPGNHAALANVVNDVVQLRMHHRFAAGNGDDRCSQVSKLVQPTLDDVERHIGIK